VTVSKDGSARVWRSDGVGEPLMLWLEGLRQHGVRPTVNASSFSPDGNRIVTGSEDGTARAWWLSGSLLQAAIRNKTTICLDPEVYERYLDEVPEEARRKYEACEHAHGRKPTLEVSCQSSA
jgi:WD40 repeat protein